MLETLIQKMGDKEIKALSESLGHTEKKTKKMLGKIKNKDIEKIFNKKK